MIIPGFRRPVTKQNHVRFIVVPNQRVGNRNPIWNVIRTSVELRVMKGSLVKTATLFVACWRCFGRDVPPALAIDVLDPLCLLIACHVSVVSQNRPFVSRKNPGDCPQDSHVRDKIRQQLQVLRDLGYLEFPERGRYRMLL